MLVSGYPFYPARWLKEPWCNITCALKKSRISFIKPRLYSFAGKILIKLQLCPNLSGFQDRGSALFKMKFAFLYKSADMEFRSPSKALDVVVSLRIEDHHFLSMKYTLKGICFSNGKCVLLISVVSGNKIIFPLPFGDMGICAIDSHSECILLVTQCTGYSINPWARRTAG